MTSPRFGCPISIDLLVDHRQPDAVLVLVDEDEVADLQRRKHRARRDAERLVKERAQQEDEQDDREEAGGVFEPGRLAHGALFQAAALLLDDGFLARQRGRVAAVEVGQQAGCPRSPLLGEDQLVGDPQDPGEDGQYEQDQGKVHLSSTCRIARKASCGISTVPTCFMRFLPAFCFSSSFFLRVMSPP